VFEYFTLRVEQCAQIAAAHVVRSLQADLKSVRNELNQFRRELKQLVRQVTDLTDLETQPIPNSETSHHAETTVDEESDLLAFAQSNLEPMCQAVNESLHAAFLSTQGGLYSTVMNGGRPRAQLLATLRDHAQKAVHELLDRISALEGIFDGRREETETLSDWLRQASPKLLSHGGTRRNLVVLPRSAATEHEARIAEILGTSATKIKGTDNSMTICVEAAELPLVEVAIDIVQRRRDYAEFAERVRTRSDINWTKLTDNISQPLSKAAQVAAVTHAMTSLSDALENHTQILV
jgi:hypothetical protein